MSFTYFCACKPGFPLDKAVSYAKLRNPLLLNDLNMQYYIQDRYADSHYTFLVFFLVNNACKVCEALDYNNCLCVMLFIF